MTVIDPFLIWNFKIMSSLCSITMRFLQKIKFLPNVILMLETFRYVLAHVKYKISAKKSTGKVTVFEIPHILMYFTSDWSSDWLKSQGYGYVMKEYDWYPIVIFNAGIINFIACALFPIVFRELLMFLSDFLQFWAKIILRHRYLAIYTLPDIKIS